MPNSSSLEGASDKQTSAIENRCAWANGDLYIAYHDQVPARTAQSDAMSKDLINRGFKFVGSTICYAFMQAVGMVNDHTANCFRYVA